MVGKPMILLLVGKSPSNSVLLVVRRQLAVDREVQGAWCSFLGNEGAKLAGADGHRTHRIIHTHAQAKHAGQSQKWSAQLSDCTMYCTIPATNQTHSEYSRWQTTAGAGTAGGAGGKVFKQRQFLSLVSCRQTDSDSTSS